MTQSETLGGRGEQMLRRVSQALDLGRAGDVASDLLRIAASSWFDRPPSAKFPVMLLEGTAMELCYYLPPHDDKELRFTVEPVGEQATLLSYWDATANALEKMCAHQGFAFDALRKLYEVARPKQDAVIDGRTMRWAGWLGGGAKPSGEATLRTYMCLAHVMNDPEQQDAIFEAAGIAPELRRKLPPDIRQRIGMMSSTITKEGIKRVKIYVVMLPLGPHTGEALDRLGSFTEHYRQGECKRFLEIMSPEGIRGEPTSPFAACTMHAVGNQWDRLSLNINFYQSRHRPPVDELVARTRRAIKEFGADEEAYDRFARVAGYENVTVVTFQRHKQYPALTLYAGVPIFNGDQGEPCLGPTGPGH